MDKIEKDSSIDQATNFSKLDSSEKLKHYLSAPERIKNSECIFHYTRLCAAVEIIKSGYWILFNPGGMNDGLELNHLKKGDWENIFFSSFMREQKESIAMWSMYAQPWAKGVKISIKNDIFKKWIRDTKVVYAADSKTKKVIDTPIPIGENIKIITHAIAYTDCENISDDTKETLTFGNTHNSILRGTAHDLKLLGYIKNSAWEYEKEFRLRVDTTGDYCFDAVALKLTPEMISAMEIVKGPRFEGDLDAEMKKYIETTIKTNSSLYTGKLKKIPCDKCDKPKR